MELHQEIRDPINTKYLSNKPTNRQKKGYVSYEDILNKRNSLKTGSDEQLLLAIYTMIPPVRSDYDKVKIYYTQGDYRDNHIVLNNNPYIILENYKTAKRYHILKIHIPNELETVIKESLKLKPREYLFVRKNGTTYTSNTFNKWANRTLKKLFDNKNISLTTLRHIYISRRDLKLEERSGLQRKEIAKIMGHSVEQQQKYLWHTYLKEDLNK